MAEKIIRDPVYDYISIDRKEDQWALDIIDSPEFQRLRYIHQLGVSHLTYPGATHTRFSHSLGVYHLANIALDSLGKDNKKIVAANRKIVLAAALLHDIGHGPFSHLLESVIKGSHEDWTVKIIQSSSSISNILKKYSIPADQVITLIQGDKLAPSLYWAKALISSQLDCDRMDFLLRDSHFTGSRCGIFDWYRLIKTMHIQPFTIKNIEEQGMCLMWSPKAKNSIEEYLFSRYYMYQNVYYHKTTSCFDKMLQAIFQYAKESSIKSSSNRINNLLSDNSITIQEYMEFSEADVLAELCNWKSSPNRNFYKLVTCFLERKPFAHTPLSGKTSFEEEIIEFKERVIKRLKAKGYSKFFLLEDEIPEKKNSPYQYEAPEDPEQIDPTQGIFLTNSGSFEEITESLPRLKAVQAGTESMLRYYYPKEIKEDVEKIKIDLGL